MSGQPDCPLIRITRGQPDDAEVAALTTAIVALSSILALSSRTEQVRRDTVQRRTRERAALPAGSWRSGGG